VADQVAVFALGLWFDIIFLSGAGTTFELSETLFQSQRRSGWESVTFPPSIGMDVGLLRAQVKTCP
jgi:hypothetical protein